MNPWELIFRQSRVNRGGYARRSATPTELGLAPRHMVSDPSAASAHWSRRIHPSAAARAVAINRPIEQRFGKFCTIAAKAHSHHESSVNKS